MEYYYEDSGPESHAIRLYYCGKCDREMELVQKKDALCPKCRKRGWNVVFYCKNCGTFIKEFRQDMDSGPRCVDCP